VDGVELGRRYGYRLLLELDLDALHAGPIANFRTLDPPDVARQTQFVVVTGVNRFAFLALALKDLSFEDREWGEEQWPWRTL
jgi:hypothetical protein